MDEEYKFNNSELDNLWYIFVALSDVTFSMPEVSLGKQGRYALSCETMMSAMNTITSIDFCMNRSAYADAYTLVRKLRDDLMQYLFILNVIKNMKKTSDKGNDVSIEELFSDADKLWNMINKDIQFLISGEGKSDVELAMESWMYNELEKNNNTEYRKKYYDTSKYKNYLISQNSEIKELVEEFLNPLWKDIDRKLNNYVHGNGIKYITNNYVFQDKKDIQDGELVIVVKMILIIFLSILTLVDSTKMQSSDYMDALDMGEKPEENSQYWVCPCIVDFMNHNIDRKWLEYMQEHEKYGMKILCDFY